ncbi:cytochrome c peroxidase [Lignipirellula cremea]|uniref:Cytochrome c551 peroxidase n=1 Tax=Lignipirellula cremea TaxID=2528010 RepID=A0A518DZK2_9BACT|nr:cytochrome c peroxidase [Lignipirellula cremea]QDU97263.1 Cytochrome c551 peroxidase precursor [Lignipirellula cremea]
MCRRFFQNAAVWIGCCTAVLASGTTASDCLAVELPTQLRRPVSLLLDAEDHYLYTANRRSGSISVIDTTTRQTIGEWPVGQRLADLVAGPEGQMFAVDEEAGQLLRLSTTAGEVSVQERLDVGPDPVAATIAADGRGFLSSRWSRRLITVQIDAQSMRVLRRIDLPFAPRELLLLDNEAKLLVADTHGGQFLIVDAASGKVLHDYTLPAHNIRGLARSADGKMLLMAHQMLNDLAHTVHNDVHWGLLMSNDLRWLPLRHLLAGAEDLYHGAHMHPLGDASRAAADPAGIAVAANGVVVVALSGVDEVALGREDDFTLERLAVGRRPVDVVVDRRSRFAYTANQSSDSVSVVDIVEQKTVAEISLGPAPERTAVDRGEELFHNGRLSLDGWMSCHSCHTDGHTNGLMSDNLSDYSFGAPKRVLSLLGVAGTAPFAWNAGSATLKEQIRKSITNTMQGSKEPPESQVADLAAYLKTLKAPPALDQLREQADPDAIDRGSRLFTSLSCRNCHAPPLYTTPETYDVGLQDQIGNRKFNPPSLIGVGQRGPFFHDSSAATLRDVFQEHGHRLDHSLEPQELSDLLAFLRSL